MCAPMTATAATGSAASSTGSRGKSRGETHSQACPGPRRLGSSEELVKKYDVERRTRRTRRKTLSIFLCGFRGFCVVRDLFTRSEGLRDERRERSGGKLRDMTATRTRVALLAVCSTILVAAAWLAPSASSQAPETHAERAERFRTMSISAETKGLAEPFKGITTNGAIEPGLFAIKSTGVSTEPVRKAADALLAALNKAQRGKTVFGVDDVEWRKWMNQDYYVRQGGSFLEMTDAQREIAIQLLRASLSPKGLKQTRDIMRLNYTLGEMNDNDFDRYGEWR